MLKMYYNFKNDILDRSICHFINVFDQFTKGGLSMDLQLALYVAEVILIPTVFVLVLALINRN